jgi:hypothetical protein
MECACLHALHFDQQDAAALFTIISVYLRICAPAYIQKHIDLAVQCCGNCYCVYNHLKRTYCRKMETCLSLRNITKTRVVIIIRTQGNIWRYFRRKTTRMAYAHMYIMCMYTSQCDKEENLHRRGKCGRKMLSIYTCIHIHTYIHTYIHIYIT